MPTAERLARQRNRSLHKVYDGNTGLRADPDAVAILLRAFGYPTTPPKPIVPLSFDSCRFHVLA